MKFVFPPAPAPAVPVIDSENLFPVHRIYCVGRNYGDHVKEMGGDPKQEPPVFFSKPANAIVINDASMPYPQATSDLHHEVELVIALLAGGKNIAIENAIECVYGYAVGIDFTRRDLQLIAKNAGRPWDVAKGFDNSAPISAIRQLSASELPADTQISLSVNDVSRQSAVLSDMIWSVAEIISELSNFFELKEGDLIYTGTPAGVSAVKTGDRLKASIDGVAELELELL